MKLIKKIKRSKVNYKEFLPTKNKEVSNPFFIHIHIPKTGGTTFNSILKNNFKHNFEEFSGRFIFLFDKFNTEQILRFLKLQTSIDCVTSHNFTALIPYDNPVRPIIAFAFLRDPVDLFFSMYFHLRHRGGDFIESKMDLDEYIQYKIDTNYFDKGFLHTLTGAQNNEGFQYIENLIKTNRLFLFDTYRMDDAMKILGKHFPGKFKNPDFKIENISKKDQTVTEAQKKLIQNTVSKYDFNLLKLSNIQMDELIR